MLDNRIIRMFAMLFNVAPIATKFIKVRSSVRMQFNSFGSDVEQPSVLAGAIYI